MVKVQEENLTIIPQASSSLLLGFHTGEYSHGHNPFILLSLLVANSIPFNIPSSPQLSPPQLFSTVLTKTALNCPLLNSPLLNSPLFSSTILNSTLLSSTVLNCTLLKSPQLNSDILFSTLLSSLLFYSLPPLFDYTHLFSVPLLLHT